jgi:hypothetical protein
MVASTLFWVVIKPASNPTPTIMIAPTMNKTMIRNRIFRTAILITFIYYIDNTLKTGFETAKNGFEIFETLTELG